MYTTLFITENTLLNCEDTKKNDSKGTVLFSVGVTGFEPATTRPPDAYSKPG